MQRRVQLGFLAVFVVLALIVGYIVLNPASTKDELSIVQSAITSVAIFVGGAFAVFKLQIFRDFEPHLTISQEVSHRFSGNNYVHIAVTSTLNNSSKVRVEVRKGLFRLQRILPVSDAEVEYLRDQVFEHRAFEDIQWPKCYELTRTWQKNQFIVEPGESLQATCEFIVPSTVKSVLVYTYSVFPTVTRVNVSSMVTGMNPGGHGLAGNRLMFRDLYPNHAVSAMEPELARVAKAGRPVLLAPTLAEILSQNGREYVAIGVGTSGNAYLHNPNAEDSADRLGGATIHPAFALPRALHESLLDRFGQWPEESRPNTARMAHAMRILTEYVLPERMPAVSLIWSSEPDKSQHDTGVGSQLSDIAIKEADGQLGNLMQWLRETGRAAETDIIVVSDHGYSTISETVDVEAQLRAAGFPTRGDAGSVVVAQNGGAALFYTRPGDQGTADRLAAWLMAQPWCGTVTVSDAVAGIPGTLPASLVGNEGPRAPDLTVSFRWDSSPNEAGYQGMVYATGGEPGAGQHGSMSRHEIHGILFGSGPSFNASLKLDTPSSTLDLAPTILNMLGITGEWGMHGRVLEEALAGGCSPSEVAWSTQVHQAEHNLGGQVYRQQIKLSRVGLTTYVDQGNRIGSP